MNAGFLQDLDPRIIDKRDLDPRVSFDKEEDKWIFEDPSTNEEYEYNEVLERWIPIDIAKADLTEAQQEIQAKRQRKLKELKEQKDIKQEKPRADTAVYVSGLPHDTDLAELNQLFSKYGVIAVDLLTNKPKIKLYRNDKGDLKGDALVIYMKPESVGLSIQMLHETKLRTDGDAVISVQKAIFEKNEGPSSNKRELTEEDRKVIKRRLKQLNNKIEDWHGDDDTINPKWLRTVILKRVFTLKELEEDPQAKSDIIEDITEGCEDLGKVEKVILFDLEEEGVVLVRFATDDAANKCIEKMDGRFFGGQKLIATRYNGEQYSKTEEKIALSKPGLEGDSHSKEDGERLNDYINQCSQE